MADARQPHNSRLEDRSRALGCLILGLLALIIVAVMIAMGWRSMWWQDTVPEQPQLQFRPVPSPGDDLAPAVRIRTPRDGRWFQIV